LKGRGPLWVIILATAAVHAGAQIVLTPPWEHYDEPRHMAYVVDPDWDGRAPQSNPRVLEVARSLERTGFYRRSGLQFPDLGPGPAQATLYHRLASWFVAILAGAADAEIQLLAARLFSAVLYMLTVVLALDIGRTLKAEPDGVLPGMIVALWPAYVHHMTAVNNDVGVTAAFSACLWAGVKLLVEGVHFGRLAALALSTAAAIYTKDQGLLAGAFAAMVLSLAVRRSQLGRAAVLSAVVVVYGLAMTQILPLTAPAYWQVGPETKRVTGNAVHGKAALKIKAGPKWVDAGQPLPADRMPSPGSTVSFGGWVWSDEPAVGRLILHTDAGAAGAVEIKTAGAPTFVSITATVPLTAQQAALIVGGRSLQADTEASVYFDGVVLARGSYRSGSPTDLDWLENSGTWEGKPFDNLVRNGSFELVWPDLQTATDHIRFADKLVVVLDPAAYGWVYWPTVRTVVRSLWADLGWSSAIILGDPDGTGWLWLTGIGLAGALALFFRDFKLMRALGILPAVVSVALVCVAVWMVVLMRTDFIFWGYKLTYISRARYGFPVAIPTLWVIVKGLLFWLPPPIRRYRLEIAALGLGALGLLGLWTIVVTFTEF
jgi:hypothetical protein